jgi:glycosyltransferase involved in cell wall biosynthesis
MPEVAGDAAILVDPMSISSIADGMARMANDENLRKSLVEKGIERSALFSWQKSSERLWNTIQKALDTINQEAK